MSSFIVGTSWPGTEMSDHPFDVEYYRHSYFELSQEIAALGGEMVVVRGRQTYLGSGRFARAWKLLSPQEYQEQGEITVDVVFDKGKFPTDHTIPVFNHPDIHEICTNKFTMYERLRDFCPATILAQNHAEYQAALTRIRTEKAVVKPLAGHEGYGVQIAPAESLAQVEVEFPVIVQEFLDTSVGIPGIVDGYHDLRVALFDGEILYSYVRTPPPGKLTANVSQGGTFRMVNPDELPDELMPIISQIDQKLAYVGPRFYGIDFGMTAQGPQIIEMNSRLGLLPNGDSPVFVLLKQKLAKAFQTLALRTRT